MQNIIPVSADGFKACPPSHPARPPPVSCRARHRSMRMARCSAKGSAKCSDGYSDGCSDGFNARRNTKRTAEAMLEAILFASLKALEIRQSVLLLIYINI